MINDDSVSFSEVQTYDLSDNEQLHNTGPLLKVHQFSGSFGSTVDDKKQTIEPQERVCLMDSRLQVAVSMM